MTRKSDPDYWYDPDNVHVSGGMSEADDLSNVAASLRSLVHEQRARIAELEAEVARLADAFTYTKHISDFERLWAERDELRGELALVRLAYASVITERDRLKAASHDR